MTHTAVTEQRLEMRHAGFEPVPLLGKAPTLKGWQKVCQETTDHTITNWECALPALTNTGCLTRLMPALDLDITNPEAAEACETWVRKLYEDWGVVLVRIGKAPKRAIVFRTERPFAKITVNLIAPNGDKTQRIELLCDGQQLVMFGRHPDTGKDYGWHGGVPGKDVALADLPVINEKEAQELVTALADMLCRDFGYSIANVTNGHHGPANGAAGAAGDWSPKAWAELVQTIQTGSAGLHDAIRDLAAKCVQKGMGRDATVEMLWELMDQSAGAHDKRWQDYRDDIPRAVDSAFGKGYHHQPTYNAAGFGWDEPDDSVLQDRRGELPELPLDLVPPRLRRWLCEAARNTGTTPTHVFMPAIGIAGGLIGVARIVRVTPSFFQPMAIWAMTVAPSGGGKTPGLLASKGHLDRVARELSAKNDEEKKTHDEKEAKAKALLARWQSAIKAADKAGEAHPPMPADARSPGTFVPLAIYVTDATIERITSLLTRRPHGLTLVMDELAGLFANFGRYSHGSDVEFWLAAHNGSGHRVDRMSRESIYVPHLMVGIVGGTQPDVIATTFDGPANGLSARFMYAYPSEPDYVPLSEITGDRSAVFARGIRRLVTLTMEREEAGEDIVPVEVPLSRHGRAELEHLRKAQHEQRPYLAAHELEWWCKADMHAIRLAGVLAYLDWALSEDLPAGGRFDEYYQLDPPPPPEPVEITGEQMAIAVRLVTEFFWPHARAVMRHIGAPTRSDRNIVLRYMQAELRAGNTMVSQRTIQREVLGQRLDSNTLAELLDEIATTGWARRHIPPAKPGRPALLWEVNPRLRNALCR